ncbi:MAG: porphobilinogen synthase [Phycisphaerae bacterium]|nr:porphobilinogen synthase [Phycisphaerae bacterium]
MGFPEMRLSRMRGNEVFRGMVRENKVELSDLVQPIFVHHGENIKNEIKSMPGQFQYSVENACAYIQELYDLGLRAVLLFGIPKVKDEQGSDSWDDQGGIIQQALRAMKQACPGMMLITDVCFCEYTSHGHCGVMVDRGGEMVLDHDATLEKLALQAVSHAMAGADMVAPSGMIDGGIAAIRQALDMEDFNHIPIMAYSAKYASSFYGPFRDAADGAPKYGDRRTHQMDCANRAEAIREVELDVVEGADIVMVKPGLAYMDVINDVKATFGLPTAVYNVSGEYAMVKAAGAQGWIDAEAVTMEILLGFKRAGADIILTYHAEEVARDFGIK